MSSKDEKHLARMLDEIERTDEPGRSIVRRAWSHRCGSPP